MHSTGTLTSLQHIRVTTSGSYFKILLPETLMISSLSSPKCLLKVSPNTWAFCITIIHIYIYIVFWNCPPWGMYLNKINIPCPCVTSCPISQHHKIADVFIPLFFQLTHENASYIHKEVTTQIQEHKTSENFCLILFDVSMTHSYRREPRFQVIHWAIYTPIPFHLHLKRIL